MLILIDVVVCFPLLLVHSLHWSILFYSVFSIVIRAFGCIGRYYFIVYFPLLYVHSLHWSILFYCVFSIVIRAFGCIGRYYFIVFSIVIRAFIALVDTILLCIFHCFPLLYMHLVELVDTILLCIFHCYTCIPLSTPLLYHWNTDSMEQEEY